MPVSTARSVAPSLKSKQPRQAVTAGRPFLGLIDGILVSDPVDFEFEGAVAVSHAAAAWAWMVRDLASDLIDVEVSNDEAAAAQALDSVMPELLARAGTAIAEASGTRDGERRLMSQLGGEAPYARLPNVLNALKCRSLLNKALGFGRAVNGIADDAALASALQSMPLQDPVLTAMILQAAVGQVINPARLTAAAARIAGSSSESAIQRAGLGPLVEALLAHAQNQVPVLGQIGPFADIDLICRAIDRFHRLMRSVNSLELSRHGRWAMIVGALTKAVSERIEPRLRDVGPDVNRALRRGREGADRFDPDLLLSALNGVYVLASVRDARDTLALNAAFDQTWTQVGQSLEIHIERNLEILRQSPGDRATAQRLDAAIKMAELRFNADYAEVLRRAKETAERRS